jgi:hypothetical protein
MAEENPSQVPLIVYTCCKKREPAAKKKENVFVSQG